MNIIKYLAEGIYKNNFLMSICFFNEVGYFIITGGLLAINFLMSIFTLIIAFFNAFVLGEAIRIRARRGD